MPAGRPRGTVANRVEWNAESVSASSAWTASSIVVAVIGALLLAFWGIMIAHIVKAADGRLAAPELRAAAPISRLVSS